MKGILSDLTIVVPLRIDSEERQENMLTGLRWVAAWGCEVLLLEAAPSPSFTAEQVQQLVPTASYLFMEDAAPIFHRTHCINLLLQRATTPWVGIWDSDVILSKDSVIAACEKLRQNPRSIVYPYNGNFVMHSPSTSKRFRQTLNPAVWRNEQQSCLGRRSCGGAFVVNKEQYLRIGGENERFVGWGPEDAERLHRCQILGWDTLWVGDESLHHLYHPQKRSPKQEERLCSMRKELVHECSLSPSALLSYIKETYTWNK